MGTALHPAPNERAQCRSCEPPPLDQRLRREACDGLRVDRQRRAASALVLLMLLCGCPQRVAVAPAPAPPVIAPHDAGSSACSADIEARAPGAEPVKDAELDLDGDGLNDLVFRSSGDLHGNSKFFLYRVDGACAHFVGSVTAFIVNTPHCVTRPPKGICRLSAMRRMMHDDYQETFYEAASGELVEAGAGQYIPTPPNKKPRR